MHTLTPAARRTARLTVAAALLSGSFAAGAAAAYASPKPGHVPVTICHRTNSNTNPYVQETVDADGSNGSLGKGHNDHTSHTGPVWDPTLKAQHIKWGDIIPPYDYSGGHYFGLNWEAGQAIWENGCQVPETPPTTPAPLVLSGQCDPDVAGLIDWTVVNPEGNDTASDLTVNGVNATPDPTSIDGGQAANFNSEAPATGVSVTGMIDEQPVDSNTVDFTDTCTTSQGGSSNPAVSGKASCASGGITVNLSNAGGTKPATFTVTKPNGSTRTVKLGADASKSLFYAVSAHKSGSASVAVDGKTIGTFTQKACVQPVNIHRNPQSKPPTKTPTVLGEHVTKSLPFTGSRTQFLSLLAVSLMLGGMGLLVLGGRRPAKVPFSA